MTILLLMSCAILQNLTESPTEKLQRLETEYKTNMESFISNSGISLQSSKNENILISMAKSITNAVTSEGIEAECLSIGSGKSPTIGISFLAEEKNKNDCVKFAMTLQKICSLQKELQKPVYVYCDVVNKVKQ